MELPHKIYIYVGSMGSLFAHKEPDIPYVETTEYIKKDALLKWADTHLCEQGFSDGEAEHGYRCAINDLIISITQEGSTELI